MATVDSVLDAFKSLSVKDQKTFINTISCKKDVNTFFQLVLDNIEPGEYGITALYKQLQEICDTKELGIKMADFKIYIIDKIGNSNKSDKWVVGEIKEKSKKTEEKPKDTEAIYKAFFKDAYTPGQGITAIWSEMKDWMVDNGYDEKDAKMKDLKAFLERNVSKDTKTNKFN